MRAAVVTEFGHAPRYAEIDLPPVTDEDAERMDVVAAALHPRVRSQAAGSHYTSGTFEDDAELPLIPGIDGVARRADGSLVYFVLPDTRFGSMAEHAVVDLRRTVPLPAGASPVTIAAAMNPAMSSWLALRKRARLEPGQSVLILGATGSAGRLAIEVARHLGAARVVAAGRDPETLEKLTELGADTVVSLAGDPVEAAARVGEAAADVDIVIDYLFGPTTQATIPALLSRRADRSAHLDWVQVGAITGPEITIASAFLRGADIALMGSGQGSVSTRDIVTELIPLMEAVDAGSLPIETDARPLTDVESVWDERPGSRRRIVLTLG
ncbi:MAG TPA: zinc-binding alcohol dehydrogenase family protein [Pseudolysinimonas sp.]|jgi:NADPH:quinone reductase-like Zn-dependent oxidoreductase